jgi:hypothetical protein
MRLDLKKLDPKQKGKDMLAKLKSAGVLPNMACISDTSVSDCGNRLSMNLSDSYRSRSISFGVRSS